MAAHRQLAPSASIRVSPLCLGAMTFGDSQQERYGEITKEIAFKMLDHFYESGGNFIDTANAYQNGESEQWVGEWMQKRDVRDQIVLATKYTSGFQGHLKSKGVQQSNFSGNNSKSMRLSIENSLKSLQTTYIDLFYVHWWDYTTSIPELMHSLNDLVVSGKVIYLGISDTPAWIVSKANQYARDHGLRQFSVYQGKWNAGLRDFERDIIPMCTDEGMALCPYGVLGQGRFHTKADYLEREKHNPGRKFTPINEEDKHISSILEGIAERKGNGATIHGIALTYVLQKAPYVFPIVGGRKIEHIKGNIESLDIELTDEEIAEIEKGYPFDHGFPHNFLSGTLFERSGTSRPASHPSDVWLTKVSAPGLVWHPQRGALKASDVNKQLS